VLISGQGRSQSERGRGVILFGQKDRPVMSSAERHEWLDWADVKRCRLRSGPSRRPFATHEWQRQWADRPGKYTRELGGGNGQPTANKQYGYRVILIANFAVSNDACSQSDAHGHHGSTQTQSPSQAPTAASASQQSSTGQLPHAEPCANKHHARTHANRRRPCIGIHSLAPRCRRPSCHLRPVIPPGSAGAHASGPLSASASTLSS
jgi:hypothetical protein